MWTFNVSTENFDDPVAFAGRIAANLARINASADVTPRFTSTAGKVEAGATIALYDCGTAELPQVVWQYLRHRHGLGCAYVVADDFEGCSKEYFRPHVYRASRFPNEDSWNDVPNVVDRKVEALEASSPPVGIEGISYPFARR
jgi:hypothetical protein